MNSSHWFRYVLQCLVLTITIALTSIQAKSDVLYSPKMEDFRPIYDQDNANKDAQTWDGDKQYWDWVQKFYKGNSSFFVRERGWTKRSQELLAKINQESTKQEVIKILNPLGRQIAGEWAKEVRKIDTFHDLRRWSGLMDQAGRDEDGTGQKTKAALQRIAREVKQKLSKK